MAKRQYSDADKATALAALDANANNVARTARELGIPRKTLMDWAHDIGVVPDVAQIRHKKKGELADRLEEIANALSGDLLDESKRVASSLKDTATALGITIDKMQLLRGEPTEISSHAAESLDRKLATLSARMGETGVSNESDTRGKGSA